MYSTRSRTKNRQRITKRPSRIIQTTDYRSTRVDQRLSRVCLICTRSNIYDKMNTTINAVPTAHDKDYGYLVAVLDKSVKHMYKMSFGWVLLTAKGIHLAKSFGGCDGRSSSLKAEAVEMLSISIFIALMAKHRKCTNIKIKYVSDNLELINRSKEHLKYNNPYPNKILSA